MTSNHFSPLDSTIIRKLAKKTGRRRLYTVSQDTNFAVPGMIGFFLYYADTIPITSDSHYTKEAFLPLLRSLLGKKAMGADLSGAGNVVPLPQAPAA